MSAQAAHKATVASEAARPRTALGKISAMTTHTPGPTAKQAT